MSQPNEPVPPPRLRVAFGPRRMRWLILLILVGPCAALQAPLEVGRWKLAAAMQARSDGKHAAAYAKLTEALRWMPADTALHMQRVQWRLDDGSRDQALADADQLLAATGESYRGLVLHSLIMQKLGNHQAAVEDWKKIDQLSQRSGTPSRAEALNGLAYVQAVANVELDEALQHVEDALDLVGKDAHAHLQFLDTRGYVRYLKGQYQLAHDDMNAAIEIWNRLDAEARNKKKPPPTQAKPIRVEKRHLDLLQVDLPSFNSPPTQAVLHYHRALVLEALGKGSEASQDRAVVRALIGREPDETLF